MVIIASTVIGIIMAASAVAGMAANMWQAAKQKEDIQAALNEIVAQQQEEDRKRQEEAGTAGGKVEQRKEGNWGIIAAVIGIIIIIAVAYSMAE
jgi:preprotein translocase subunit SecF